MSKDDKQQIIKLKESGYGYKKIAKELGMTVSQVRYVCLKYESESELIGNCKHCGIEIKSVKGKKRKTFCSDRCRWDWWNKHNRELKHENQ